MKSLAGLLLAALSITPLVSAAAQFEGTGYLIKHFLLQVPRFQQSPPQFQNISLSFDLIDTDGSANTTSYTFCKAVWNSRIANAAPDSENRVRFQFFLVWPTNSIQAACRDSRYGFYIGAGDFTGPHANLTLEAQHSFEDPRYVRVALIQQGH